MNYTIIFFFLCLSIFAMSSAYKNFSSSSPAYADSQDTLPNSQAPLSYVSANINIDETHDNEDESEKIPPQKSRIEKISKKFISKLPFKHRQYSSPFLEQRVRPPES